MAIGAAQKPSRPVWRAHPGPQERALQRPEFEVFFGGSRGPGKTDAGIVWLTGEEFEPGKLLVHHPLYRALVIRKNFNDLTDWIDRATRFFVTFGGKKSSAGNTTSFVFPSGAVIRTGHLKDADTYTKYQGHEYQRMLIEEATQIPDEKRYMQLISSCRSTIPEIRPQIFLTANPGGKGHGWCKQRFIDTAHPMRPYKYRGVDGVIREATIGQRFKDEQGLTRIYVPARIDDNPTLMINDPNYVKVLDALKSTDEQLWKAWRMGDWDVFVGQVFDEWRQDTHISPRPPFSLALARKVVCFDWGYRDPGCAYWIAASSENQLGVRHRYVYRELYQTKTEPKEWARQMGVLFKIEPVEYIVLPHDCFDANRGQTSIADIFMGVWKEMGLQITVRRANTQGEGARIRRVAVLHQELALADDGIPYTTFHPNCKNLIRTLPSLVYDDIKVEDVDTELEDHGYDAVSTGLMTERDLSGSSVITITEKKEQKDFLWAVDSEGDYLAPDFQAAERAAYSSGY